MCNIQFSSVTQLYPTLCDPLDCSSPGFPVHPQLLFKWFYLLFLAGLGLQCPAGFALVAESGGYSVVVAHGLLTAVASLVEHRLQDAQASVAVPLGLQSSGSVVVVHRLICSMAHGVFPDQGSNLYHWQVDSLPLNHQGNLTASFFKGSNYSSLNVLHQLYNL